MGKSDPREYYIEEAKELIDSIEQLLMELEDSPEDVEIINNIFRALHTIKGSGSMFGFNRVASFTHEVETLFDMLREQKLTVDKNIIDLTLAARDQIYALLFSANDEEIDNTAEENLLQKLKSYTSKPNGSVVSTEHEKKFSSEDDDQNVAKTYRIIFRPQVGFFLRGARIVPLLKELDSLGTCITMVHTHDVPAIKKLDPDKCYLSWTILITTASSLNTLRDVFIFVEDYSNISIDIIDEEDRIDTDEDYKQIGEILFEQGHIQKEDIETVIKKKERFGEIAVESGVLTEDSLESALEEQKYIRSIRKKRKDAATSTTIRVHSEKLDTLVDLVGELVTLQARLSQFTNDSYGSSGKSAAELEIISETLERLTSELRDTTMNVRMVPIGETFNSFNRLVRDLSNELSKEIRLETYGTETELDKNIIDALKDPLVHIIRNSVDHGIESPAEREQKGKPCTGNVTIGAEYSGANVLITIRDDGKGLDPTKIFGKAVEKGIVSADTELTYKEKLLLIFRPGFSTAEQATSVSGRGVGMDVVKKNIERLRGSVDITSKKGEGTTISLTIPLTLSIIDGLLITVAGEKYVINLNEVDECFDAQEELFKNSKRHDYISVRDEIIPYIDLRENFLVAGSFEGIRQIVVVNVEDKKIALLSDTIIGQHQTVIKPLSSIFRRIEEISGSTILGNGTIAFILDINKLYQKAMGI
jgi:two-component system, chemotaxis family, sensor kinase CheA